jgi:hypothetical protein
MNQTTVFFEHYMNKCLDFLFEKEEYLYAVLSLLDEAKLV